MALSLLAGCVSPASNQPKKDIFEYPEAHAHSACLDRRAAEFARMQGNPIDLAYVAAGGCKSTRLALAKAMSGSRAFIDTFVSEGQETDTRLIAEKIYRVRSGQ